MSDFRRRFDPSEIGSPAADATDLLGAARDLEAYADIGWTGPSANFEDRVMTAIAVEPAPRLLGGPGIVATLRQAWRLAWSGGRPIAVRAQAIALVLLATVALAGAGSIAVVAASRFMTSQVEPPPTIQPSPSPTPSPTPSPSISPSPSPSVSPAPTPTSTARPSATETDEPGGTDDHGGSGSGGSDSSGPGPGGEDRTTSGDDGHSGSDEAPEPTEP
jgi:hypothetical protein